MRPLSLSTLVAAPLLLAGGALAQTTALVSLDTQGVQHQGASFGAVPSAFARYVAFESDDSGLVAGDTNGVADIFVRDTRLGVTTRVSVSSLGAEADGSSTQARISADGRFVVFQSSATNLVPGDTNGATDLFVRDRLLGTTTRVSVDSSGAEADGPSSNAALSYDGRFVAFESWATNLVPGDTNGNGDVFVRDLERGTTTRVSVKTGGGQVKAGGTLPGISGDGHVVGFSSRATQLVPGDTNQAADTFVHDLATGQTTRVSLSSSGAQGDGASVYECALSEDGRFVAFTSLATNLVAGDTNGRWDVFVRDRMLGTTVRASTSSQGAQAANGAWRSALSADGRVVAFKSDSTDLVAGDRNGGTLDVFVKDLGTGTTRLVSRGTSGVQANGFSSFPQLSPDGGFITFYSEADNLVPEDLNGRTWDVFVRSLAGPRDR